MTTITIICPACRVGNNAQNTVCSNCGEYTGPINSDTRLGGVRYSNYHEKAYTATFKAQVVLDLLKDDKTLAQLATEITLNLVS